MATENKEQVLPRDLKRAEAELAEILALASIDGEMRERLAD